MMFVRKDDLDRSAWNINISEFKLFLSCYDKTRMRIVNEA